MSTIAPAETQTVELSAELYRDVREFLSYEAKPTTATIATFVEAAVSNYLMRRSTKQLQDAAKVSEEDVADVVEAAIDWARLQK